MQTLSPAGGALEGAGEAARLHQAQQRGAGPSLPRPVPDAVCSQGCMVLPGRACASDGVCGTWPLRARGPSACLPSRPSRQPAWLWRRVLSPRPPAAGNAVCPGPPSAWELGVPLPVRVSPGLLLPVPRLLPALRSGGPRTPPPPLPFHRSGQPPLPWPLPHPQ